MVHEGHDFQVFCQSVTFRYTASYSTFQVFDKNTFNVSNSTSGNNLWVCFSWWGLTDMTR